MYEFDTTIMITGILHFGIEEIYNIMYFGLWSISKDAYDFLLIRPFSAAHF